MSKVSKELIEIYRKIVLPYVSNQLYKADFEGQGETDKIEFEQDFNKILDLAIKALEEERPQGDLISREALKEAINTYDKFACLPDTTLVPFRILNEPEKNYEPYVHLRDIRNAIDNAPTVEPEKPQAMTNGDKLLSTFGGAQIYGTDKNERLIKVCVDNNFVNVFDLDWWNSEYEGSEDE